MSRLPWLPVAYLAMALAALPAAAQTSTAPPVAWFQLAPGCPIDPEAVVPGEGEVPQRVACGGAGIFLVGKPGLQYRGDCPIFDHGTESPALIPVEPAPRLPPAFPCALGGCFGRSGRPWVAVVDWQTAHGWSVAAAIQEASDQGVDVALYDLAAAGLLAEWVPPVSDLHVLVQLCAVAQAAEDVPGDRPLAVNMSFGRRSASPVGGVEPGLGGAVGRVLSHLAAEGILPVAAAGNHRVLLFPAASPDVVAAGALDLAHLEHRREPRPSMQTPPAAEAWMLGYGIYLWQEEEGSSWPAPLGSSYAAALLTGWLGGSLARGARLPPPPLPEGARWTPAATGKGLALALDGVPLPGSELLGPQRLFDRALGTVPFAREPRLDVTLRLTGPAAFLPELPLLYADDGNGPQPGVDPCIPCQGRWQQTGVPESGTVLVDLSSSGGVPSRMALEAVLLRVGAAVYEFDLSHDPALLAALAVGSLDTLALTDVGGRFPAGEQPSLLLVFKVGGTSYWHEVPIHLHP